MRKINLTICAFFLFSGFLLQAQSPIKVMILDGETNPYHRWDLGTPILKMLLEESKKFEVTVVSAPGKDGDFSSFMPKFSDYKAIVLNYDVPDERWPDAIKKSFEQYVANGGGLVIIHAANNSFPGWAEYNKMIGIGGWRNRTEKDGAYWYYVDGKLVEDKKPGSAGSHGAKLPFQMKVVNDHPITRGLPPVWAHQNDELYAQLRGPGENMAVLATARSEKDNKGTGYDEPQVMVLNYKKGKVFHHATGHDPVGMSSVDYGVLLTRGTEWVATGKVTQKIPANFPTATTVSYRVDIAAMNPAPAPPKPAAAAVR
ncbi:ThuA domain-containing protein [Dyadobacter arcticus]|uniref:Type 1 glutamine amidotransferase n=1 Tax=Dyadobacter arcticus TaxID=1078754 RepID=A0ABX0UPQ2_9BACT|nr:ThuA domain-containing protein [Dyadobacter arcticus]NIJ54403.1 type 1 glutamine amidotransferase [Dyadobacter arcticus]